VNQRLENNWKITGKWDSVEVINENIITPGN